MDSREVKSARGNVAEVHASNKGEEVSAIFHGAQSELLTIDTVDGFDLDKNFIASNAKECLSVGATIVGSQGSTEKPVDTGGQDFSSGKSGNEKWMQNWVKASPKSLPTALDAGSPKTSGMLYKGIYFETPDLNRSTQSKEDPNNLTLLDEGLETVMAGRNMIKLSQRNISVGIVDHDFNSDSEDGAEMTPGAVDNVSKLSKSVEGLYLRPYNSLTYTTFLKPGKLSNQRQRSRSIGSAFSVLSLGSHERQHNLAERRKGSALYGGVWRAHEGGLSLTKEASITSATAMSLRRKKFHSRSKSSIVNPSVRALHSASDGTSSNSGPIKADLLKSVSKGSTFHSAPGGSFFLYARDSQSFHSAGILDLVENGGPIHPGQSEVFRTEVHNILRHNPLPTALVHRSNKSAPLLLEKPDDASSSLNSVPLLPKRKRISSDGSRVKFLDGDETQTETTKRDAAKQAPQHYHNQQQPQLKQRSFSVVPRGIASLGQRPKRPPRSRSSGNVFLHSGLEGRHHRHNRSSSSFSTDSVPSLYHARRLRSQSNASNGSDRSFVFPDIEHGRIMHSDSDAASVEFVGLDISMEDVNEHQINRLRSLKGNKNHGLPRRKPGPPLLGADQLQPTEQHVTHGTVVSQKYLARMITRNASMSIYDGEGVEVTEMKDSQKLVEDGQSQKKLVSTEASNVGCHMGMSAHSFEPLWLGSNPGGSFDDSNFVSSTVRREGLIDQDSVHRELKRSLSDEMSYIIKITGAEEYSSDIEVPGAGEESASWDMDEDQASVHENAWNVLKDEYATGYGGGGTLPFLILGTSADDDLSTPHVLSPPLMESVQCFLPYAVSEDNFRMKFSLIRDGASLHTLLQNVRAAKHTIIAIETVGGEVFGSFTSANWRKNSSYFGTGESFLWRLRSKRGAECFSVIDLAQMESELDVYPWTGENDFVQLCTHDKIAVGGGSRYEGNEIISPTVFNAPLGPRIGRDSSWEENKPFGFGLVVDNDLLHGASNSCLTFGSPPLCKDNPEGSPFEILNLEVWTMTPCISEEEAEKMELSQLFLEEHRETSH